VVRVRDLEGKLDGESMRDGEAHFTRFVFWLSIVVALMILVT
jgi:hypothetical protein